MAKKEKVVLTDVGRFMVQLTGQTVPKALKEGGYSHIDHLINEESVRRSGNGGLVPIVVVKAPVGASYESLRYAIRCRKARSATAFETLVMAAQYTALSGVVSLHNFTRHADADLNLTVVRGGKDTRYLKAYPGNKKFEPVVQDGEVFAIVYKE